MYRVGHQDIYAYSDPYGDYGDYDYDDDYGRMLPALAVGHTPYDRLKPYMPWLLLGGGVAMMLLHERMEKPKKKRARRKR